MSILVCGNEGEWALHQNTLVAKGADTQRRGSVHIQFGTQLFRAFAAGSDIWVHVRSATVDSSFNTGTPNSRVTVRDGSGTTVCDIRDMHDVSGDRGQVRFRRPDTPGGALVEKGDRISHNDEFHDYDIHIKITSGSNANDTITFKLYFDSVLRYSESVVDASGWTEPAQLLLDVRNESSQQDDTWYQDVIVTNSIPTVGMELVTLIPNAQGNYTDFNNDYTNIDESGYDQADSISTDAVDQRESWTFAAPTFELGDRIIYAVAINTVAQTDLSEVISDFEAFLRLSGVDYDGAGLGANNISPDAYVTVWTQNPSTAQPWQYNELASIESGVHSV